MKTWIDLTSQVQRHVDRGLDLGGVSRQHFASFLYSSNYYRVSGYGRCLYEPGSDRYVSGTTAAKLMDVYTLDAEVRSLVLDGIGVVEPALRGRVAYHVTKTIGAGDAYLQTGMYLPSEPRAVAGGDRAFERWDAEIRNRGKVLDALGDIQSRDEIFIRHHVVKGDPVPFWAAVEVISLGTFSRFLRALADKTVVDPVAASFEIEDTHKLLQAVQNLTFLRNIAAHHGRLWNRRFDGHVTLPAVALRVKRDYLATRTPAAALTLLAGMVDQVEKSSKFSDLLLNAVHADAEFVDGYYKPML